MAKPAWYSKKTWTTAEREDFFARLRTVTGENEQAAALRKQAAHLLQETAKTTPGEADQLLAGARELYELFIDQFPDSAERAYAFCALGDILERSGEHDAALAQWREALAAQKGTPRSTNAHLRIGMLAIRLKRSDLYSEVERLLSDFGQTLIYPIDQYQQCGIKTHLNVHAGRRDLAILCARDALSATKHIHVDTSTDFHRLLVELTKPTVIQR
jgi:tetratricopeptide (TPR) repeat protein